MEVDGALGVSGCPGRRMAWNTERAVTAYKQAGSNIAGMRTTSTLADDLELRLPPVSDPTWRP